MESIVMKDNNKYSKIKCSEITRKTNKFIY